MPKKDDIGRFNFHIYWSLVLKDLELQQAYMVEFVFQIIK
jgi:hypothetical protein